MHQYYKKKKTQQNQIGNVDSFCYMAIAKWFMFKRIMEIGDDIAYSTRISIYIYW